MIGDIMKISRLRMGTDGKGVSTLVAFLAVHCIVNTVLMISAMKKKDIVRVYQGEPIPRNS